MFKCLALLSVIALCKAQDYYQMSIDHDSPKVEYKTAAAEPKQYTSDLKVESTGYEKEYKREDVERKGYSMPASYGQMRREDDYESGSSYSAPYGYEQFKPMYEKQSYEGQSYGQSYNPEPYVEKSYSSPISAQRSVEIKPVQSEGYGQKDHTIDVKDDNPIVIHFRTHANNIRVQQTRIPEKPKPVEHTQSEDEPHRVVHEVYKPVIQEIREIIQPFRKVVQKVQPVIEEVQTVVHKSDGRRSRGGGSGDEGYGQRQQYNNDNGGYNKRSGGRPNKKYNTIRDYLPQGSVLSAKGVPVYRSQYKGPAVPQRKY